MNQIDKIYYINLDTRKDRNLSFKSQALIRNFYPKIEKIPGISHPNPPKGCVKSHIYALKKAIKFNYNNILICEDDFLINVSNNEFDDKINFFFKEYHNWDVILLIGYDYDYVKKNNLYKIKKSQTSSAYLIKNHYFKTLLQNFEKSEISLFDYHEEKNIQKFSQDVVWKELQNKDNWYIIHPNIGVQDTNYSNLTNSVQNLFNQKYIHCKLKGRLGNQLFQVANAYYLSKKYGKYLIISGNISGLNKVYHNIITKVSNEKNTELIYESDFKFNEIVLDYKKNTIIDGYYQSELYFFKIKNFIKELFYLNNEDSKLLKELVNKYNVKNAISIHIRRGDYINDNNKNVFTQIPLSYYYDCIKYFGIYKYYIIFSDDIEWCQTQDIFINLPYKIFITHNTEYIDMFLMSECAHNIITNSTFSWWGAYLNNNIDKKILYPNQWFNSNSKNYNTQNLIPYNNNWICIYVTNITIVTAYFKLKNSKHSNEEYIGWMKNTLTMNYPFIIYILKNDIDTKKYILKCREDKLLITQIIEIDFEDFIVSKYNWDKQYEIDPERDIHNKFLYMIWNEKTEFLYKSVINNPFNSEIFFWLDIGYIRDIRTEFYYTNIDINKIPKDKLLLYEVNDNKNKTIADGMFGGYINSIIFWRNAYYQYIDNSIKNKFCGKEQNLMKDLVKIHANKLKVINGENDWFYLFWYLNNYKENTIVEKFITYAKNILNNKKYIIFIILISIILISIILLFIFRK